MTPSEWKLLARSVAASLWIVAGSAGVWYMAWFLCLYVAFAIAAPTPPPLQLVADVLLHAGPAIVFYPCLLIWWRRVLFATKRSGGITLVCLFAVVAASALLFVALRSTTPLPTSYASLTTLVLAPIGLAVSIFATIPYVSEPALQCPDCGYDLRGQRECRCPECGRTFSLGEL